MILPSKNLKIVLSFLVLLLPFSNMAFAENPLQNESMPCHQIAEDAIDHLCPKTGASSCECCEFAMPVTLSISEFNLHSVLFTFGLFRENLLPGYTSQAQIPLLRPPRFFV